MFEDELNTLDMGLEQAAVDERGYHPGELGLVRHATESAYVECDPSRDEAHLFLRVEGPYPSAAGNGLGALDDTEVEALRDLLTAWLDRRAR